MIVSRWSHDPASPLAGVKSTSRADSIMARLEADRAGAHDAIYPTPDGSLTEGTIANLFVVRGDEIATPPMSEGILAGTMRTWLLAHAGKSACARWSDGSGRPTSLTRTRRSSRAASPAHSRSSRSTARPSAVARPGPVWRRVREARERWIDDVSRGVVARSGDTDGAHRPHAAARRGGRADSRRRHPCRRSRLAPVFRRAAVGRVGHDGPLSPCVAHGRQAQARRSRPRDDGGRGGGSMCARWRPRRPRPCG